CAIVAVLTRWPPRFQQTSEAARFLALSARTLEKHRCYGTGPKYRKLGGRIVYALEDLKAWADLGIRLRPPTAAPELSYRQRKYSPPDAPARSGVLTVGERGDQRHRSGQFLKQTTRSNALSG